MVELEDEADVTIAERDELGVGQPRHVPAPMRLSLNPPDRAPEEVQ